MSGKLVVLVVAAIGWLIASIFVFTIIHQFGFFGLGFFGLLLLFICTQVELESGGSAGLFAAQARARQTLSHAERASQRHQRSLGVGTTRLFKIVGIALTVIGFGGFLYYQLG